MKTCTTTIFFLLASFTVSLGQIKPSLKGLKDKAKEKINAPSTTEPVKVEEVKGKADGEPAYDPESETYRSFSCVRDELSSVKNLLKPDSWDRNVEGRNDEAVRNLAKIKGCLTKLQNDPKEAKKQYVNDFAKDYDLVEAQRKEKFESYTLDQAYDAKIESYHKFATLGWEIQDKTLEPSYTAYYAMCKDFESSRPEKFNTDYVQRRVAAVDNFFKVEVYKVVPELDATVSSISKNLHSKNSTGEEDYLLNAKSYLKSFEEPSAAIIYNKKYLLENQAEIIKVEEKIKVEKDMLDAYIASGKYDAHVKKYKQAMVDAVKLSPKKMSNAKYEAMALKGVDRGIAVRAVIVSDVWIVKKNDFGFPLYKYLAVDLAVKFEGKCWLAYGHIRKEYEGGGVYGAEYFNFWGLQDEMNCLNVNK
jgi:hypothetical protein